MMCRIVDQRTHGDLRERNMCSRLVIIDCVSRKDSSKVRLVERDEMISALAPARVDQGFSMGRLPGRAERGGDPGFRWLSTAPRTLAKRSFIHGCDIWRCVQGTRFVTCCANHSPLDSGSPKPQ